MLNSSSDTHAIGTDVVFVTMPFAPMKTPSIALSLLKAILQEQGIESKIQYFTLEFAHLTSTRLYQAIANSSPCDLIGDWLFSRTLFGDGHGSVTTAKDYLEKIIHKFNWEAEMVDELTAAHAMAEPFIEECLRQVLALSPKIVGFTSTFQQQVGSLSLANRIKQTRPDIQIVFGGANVQGMPGIEVARQFHFVDAVVSGEGDKIVVDLFRRMLDGRSYSDIAGVYTNANVDLYLMLDQAEPDNAPQVLEMDELPYPNYDDFFAKWNALTFTADEDDPNFVEPRVLLETSRGCWWGERKHCTFCGLNGSGMNYRSKSYQRALDEILYLTSKYPGTAISCVDNIMDMKYFKDLLPTLSEMEIELNLFYEMKANLRKEQVRLLSTARIRDIQPGIESFSDHVLQLMGKGISGFQNIQCLKWCKEFGVIPHWNILYGFPAETPEDYAYMVELLPKLMYLQPPAVAVQIRLDRFSPNFNLADSLGFVDVKPYPGYTEVYPTLPDSARFNLAYYFTYGYREKQDISLQTDQINQILVDWKEQYSQSDLFYMMKDDYLLICDTRPASPKTFQQVDEPARTLYVICDSTHNMRQLHKEASELLGPITEQEIRQNLQPLIDQGFMLHDPNKDLFLSLAIPLGDYAPAQEVLAKVFAQASDSGEEQGEQLVVAI